MLDDEAGRRSARVGRDLPDFAQQLADRTSHLHALAWHGDLFDGGLFEDHG
jgi:hypothetical protein